jgi:predicted metal-binding protein
MVKHDEIKEMLNKINPSLGIYTINFDKIVFEERVKLKCFHCKRHNVNWTCPPNIPDLDYKKLLQEYENMAVIVYRCEIDDSINMDAIRISSTNELHKSMLKMEKWLWLKNEVMALSFIGGSCKLCKTGCGKEKCTIPDMARIPFEALGVNVLKTMQNIGVDVSFPVEKQLLRIGLLIW